MIKHKNFHLALFFTICYIFCSHSLFAQACSGGTPSYSINLTGNNDSIWTSTSLSRGGSCCSSNNCVEFNVTIDASSNGIKLDIISGATPGGSLNYTISCGAPQSFGQAVCLTGVGPHRITFCKPGGNSNVYRITAIPKPKIKGNLVGSAACGVYMKTVGFVKAGLTWSSVPNNTTYNSYLSCTSNCDSVAVRPISASYPLTIKYKVCGSVVGGCSSTTTCDTATVRIVSNPTVNITPDNVKVCYGTAATTITANATGGISPYNYVWNNGGTASTKSVGIGTHIVAVTDSLGCIIARDTVIVSGIVSPFVANAGSDTSICKSVNSFKLNGQVQVATGGRWLGGTGAFSPNDSTLIAFYSPSATEKTVGSVTLRLNTINSFGCNNTADTVRITINPLPNPIVLGDTIPCATKIKSYSVTATASNSYLWTITGGTILGTNTSNILSVRWGAAGNGTLTIKQTSNLGCQYTAVKNATILALPTGSTLYHY